MFAQVSPETLHNLTLAGLLAAAGSGAAVLMGATVRKNVIGPDRAEKSEQAAALCLGVLAALAAWLLVITVFNSIRHGGSSAASDPGKASPVELIGIDAIARLASLVALIPSLAVMWPSNAPRIGYSPRKTLLGVPAGLLACLAILPLMFAVQIGIFELYKFVNFTNESEHQLLRMLREHDSARMRWLVFASAVVAAPVTEEFLFRGCIQSALVVAARKFMVGYSPLTLRWAAIVGTSVLFALIHGELWLMLPIFILSLMLGYVYERTGNLWAVITVHALFNAMNYEQFLHKMNG